MRLVMGMIITVRHAAITGVDIARTLDMGLHAQRPTGGERQLDFQYLPRLQGLFQPHHHQMHPARRQPDHTAGGYLDAIRQLPHLHDAIFMNHGVDFRPCREIRRDRHQPVGLGAVIMNGQIATRRRHARRRRANLNFACLQHVHGTGDGRADHHQAKQETIDEADECPAGGDFHEHRVTLL